MENLKQAVIDAAFAVCENAAFLPDGNAQISSEITEMLGEALCDLADAEKEEYKDYLSPGQEGLNTPQVALQRAFMPEEQVRIERIIDAADQLYLAIFDEVIVPGHSYLITAKSKTAELRYCPKEAIHNFLSANKNN